MNIFFPIGAFYPSQVGGPCNTVYWHTCELTKKGYDVYVVTTSLGIKGDAVVRNRFIKNECGNVYYGEGSTWNFRTIKAAMNCIKSADIIHLNSLFHVLSIFSFFYAKIRYPKKKIVWSVRGELSPAALRFSRGKKLPLLFIYRRWMDNILFHSTSKQETIDTKHQFRGARIIQVPNFIRSYRRISVPTKDQLLFMGRIHPIKALDKLIEGLATSWRFRQSSFVMSIIGNYEGRQYGYYLKLMSMVKKNSLEDKIFFRGHISGEAKQNAYAESYFLILPSETENFGNVVAEALNQGTPVIASKGTPWEILDESNSGFHIDNSPRNIANFIDKVIDLDKDEYLRYRVNAMKLVDERFDVSIMIDVWINAYQELSLS